ncbi:MAG: SufE family protein [Pseudanabaenaceae cyanobacterium]
MDNLPESFVKTITRLQKLTDDKQRYEQLIHYGKKVPPLPPERCTEANRVPGCVSNVYVEAQLTPDGTVTYAGEADALIAKGFVGFLYVALAGLSPQTVAALPVDFLQNTGLAVSLTPSRANGFLSVFRTMQAQAAALTQP